MIIREEIIKEVNTIADLQVLNQIFEYVQVVKRTANQVAPNREKVLQLAGSLTNEEAAEVRKIINNEFNQMEGEW